MDEARLLEAEFEYVTQSSFHTDELRNKFIEFYVILTGASFSVILGLLNLPQNTFVVQPALFAIISLVIAIIGVFEVLIFVRLRRIVIECMQASVLIKEYCTRNNASVKDALLWGTDTVPKGEGWLTASFQLVLLVIFLDSVMFALAAYFLLVEVGMRCIQWASAHICVAALIGLLFLGTQVFLYRWRLRRELAQSKFEEKLSRMRGPTRQPTDQEVEVGLSEMRECH